MTNINLRSLSRFSDSLSQVYLEHAVIEQDANSIAAFTKIFTHANAQICVHATGSENTSHAGANGHARLRARTRTRPHARSHAHGLANTTAGT